MDDLSKQIKVEDLLKELDNLIEAFKSKESGFSQLDIDLAREKVRKLYDILLGIEPTETKATKQIWMDKEEEQVTLEVVEDNIEVEPEPIPEEKEIFVPEEDEVQESPKEEESVSSLDLFSGPDKNENVTVKDKISEKQQSESVAEKAEKGKTTSLKLAIGINDKFFFINELFDGNMKEYNEAIEKLDSFENIDVANNFLNLLTDKYNWNKDSDAFEQLLGFIHKKLD